MEKFMFFANSTSDAICVPARKLVEMEIDGDGESLDLRFDARIGSTSTPFANVRNEVEADLVITDNKGKEVIKSLANEIRKGKEPFIVVADDNVGTYAHVNITALATSTLDTIS
tara:strand:- start:6455 stop:6796 length:342 start_codon:yes stop_codon:yes gene_type:complete